MSQKRIAIIGGGPAGLAATERLSLSGHAVTVYDAMPTFARKFLLAGKSGLNITHSEDYARFATRFGAASARLRPALDAFTPGDVTGFPEGDEGFSIAACLAQTAGRTGCRVAHPPPLDRPRRRRLCFRNAGRA